jgi:3-methylfumaryl-CoA hydratase
MNVDSAARAPASDQDWSEWVGRKETIADLISADRAAALAATLGVDQAPRDSQMLPPGWHWIYFNTMVHRREVGIDGHPKRGGFLPPVSLPRRMWAGSRITYDGGLIVGEKAERTSVISKIQPKQGKGGALVFVTVVHTTCCGNRDCIVEEQDIVYRDPPAPNAPPAPLTPAPASGKWRQEFVPDPVLLFRYSALTYNGHRIHYDAPYARGEEGYPDLVVHGPLTATLLQSFATTCAPGRGMKRFEFRGNHPLFVSAAFSLEATASENGALNLWARGPRGELAMQASAFFA